MQTEKLTKKIESENIIVDFAMRYGNPSIRSKITNIKFRDKRSRNYKRL